MSLLPASLNAALTFRHPKSLTIANGVVDFGYCFIQISQVTSVLAMSFSLWLAILSIVVGVLLCVTILLAPAGLTLVAIGILMLWRRHNVILSGADGRSYVVQTRTADFAEQILAQLRQVVAAPAESPSYVINISAGTIETGSLVDLSSHAIVGSPGAAMVQGNVNGGLATHAGGGTGETQMRHHAANGVANGHDTGHAGHNGSSPQRPQRPTPGYRSVQQAYSPGAVSVGGYVQDSSISTHASATTTYNVSNDLQGLAHLLAQSNVAHREQLVEMLRAIQQHVAAGPSNAEHARNAWGDFARYALSYLTGVEGLIGVVERVQRWFAR